MPEIPTFTAALARHEPLRRDLERWLSEARAAGLDDESIEALLLDAFRSFAAVQT